MVLAVIGDQTEHWVYHHSAEPGGGQQNPVRLREYILALQLQMGIWPDTRAIRDDLVYFSEGDWETVKSLNKMLIVSIAEDNCNCKVVSYKNHILEWS